MQGVIHNRVKQKMCQVAGRVLKGNGRPKDDARSQLVRAGANP